MVEKIAYINSFIICAFRRILLKWSDAGGWWAGHLAYMGEMGNNMKILAGGKFERKRPFENISTREGTVSV
jgi:hypothetical protein